MNKMENFKYCGSCKYYGGDVNCGDFSCGSCLLIQYGKPNAEFSDFAYNHSSCKCRLTKDKIDEYLKNYKIEMRKITLKQIEKLQKELKEYE